MIMIENLNDPEFQSQVQDKIDNLTKPKGSLGYLETLAGQICMIQHTLSPTLKNPCNILFAADHGILAQGVSVSPKEVTWQQSYHFLEGGAGISFLCRQHGFRLMVVDAGIDHDMDYSSGIVNMKVRKGTRDFSVQAAMTPDEFNLCLQRGAECVNRVHADGCNVLSFGEMGCGNTSAPEPFRNSRQPEPNTPSRIYSATLEALRWLWPWVPCCVQPNCAWLFWWTVS